MSSLLFRMLYTLTGVPGLDATWADSLELDVFLMSPEVWIATATEEGFSSVWDPKWIVSITGSRLPEVWIPLFFHFLDFFPGGCSATRGG